ncbi:MAG: hypothetical protein AB8B63_23625 [Granulosicoccus sp.]
MSKKKKRNNKRSTKAPVKKRIARINPAPLWIESLGLVVRHVQTDAESKLRTHLAIDLRPTKPSLFVPSDMAELQPASLHYLKAFAHRHELKLVEDRRRVEISPALEQRDQVAPMIATGISHLLKQTGMPGLAKNLSHPHRLNSGSRFIPIPTLIGMAAHAARQSKRVVVLPNRMISDVLDHDTQPIAGYACKLLTDEGNTILSHFDSTNFRALGYSTGDQYVVHVCLGGGPLLHPALWANLHTMARTDLQFQLFPGSHPGSNFGLLYATYYMDMAEKPKPWWMKDDFENHSPESLANNDSLQQKAS